tara:strand:- start:156 stop:464 length:309 start_codon:yes stop_codon:yes gene_type:complete
MEKYTLKTGKEVSIKELPIDTIDNIKDMQNIVFENGKPVSVQGTHKTRTAWIRAGLGKLGNVAFNGEGVPDDIIKRLSEDEKDELAFLVQKAQELTEKKPIS